MFALGFAALALAGCGGDRGAEHQANTVQMVAGWSAVLHDWYDNGEFDGPVFRNDP